MTEKTYAVKKISASHSPEDLDRDEFWQDAHLLEDFHYPWAAGTPSPTHFQALHSKNHFYFRFQVVDTELNAVVATNGPMEIAASDRVEIFFRKDAQMDPYFCLEMDYLGRVLENSAVYYRQMNYVWSWPMGLEVKAKTTAEGYRVSGRISKASLEALELLQKNRIEAGLFRADYRRIPGQDQPGVSWISWVNPAVPKPDFHVPTAFGILQLEP